MKHKLHTHQLEKIVTQNPDGMPIFRCRKVDAKVMNFWCPLCWREHRHGLTQPFELSHRAAHCSGTRYNTKGQLIAIKGYAGYYVFWDGL